MGIEDQFRSKLLRRSGISAALICEHLGWQPDCVYQIGIGANHGETDVMVKVWEDVELYGCEPNPRVIKALKKESSLYPGTLYEVAVSDYIGTATLYCKPRHIDGASILPHTTCDDAYEVEVPVTTIDTLWPEGPKGLRTLLWVDCEGSELAALRGGEKFIEDVDVVNIELTGKTMGMGWCSQSEVHLWLLQHGFRRQWLHTQRAYIGQCDGIYVRPELFNPDICCCPCELLRKDVPRARLS